MNQFYRALHMPKGRLLKKLAGYKEIYTIAVRPAAKAHGPACATPLPALGQAPYTPLPYVEGMWYADPLLFWHQGKRWLFCEAFDMAQGRGAIAVSDFDELDRPNPPRVVLKEEYHLSFPTVFEWNGNVWMIPESGENHTLNLYRCTAFPTEWERVAAFPVGRELCDTIVLAATADGLALLCSETKPENQLYTRYRRYTLCRNKNQPDNPEPFVLEEDEPYNLQHRVFDLASRNAGPLFEHGGQMLHPTQVSTTVDYGVYLQFFAIRGASEVPVCAATPENICIEGIPTKDLIGIHTYCRDADIEVIDARYLKKVGPTPIVAKVEEELQLGPIPDFPKNPALALKTAPPPAPEEPLC